MNEKRFTLEQWTEESLYFSDGEFSAHMSIGYICKKVEKKLNEQQSTIEQLQDLCGKSDGENAKLRIENEQLRTLLKERQYEKDIAKCREENEQLKEENRKLGNIHLSIDLTYHYGYGRYLADVRVIDDE